MNFKPLLTSTAIIIFATQTFAQFGFNSTGATPDNSAMVDLVSITKGLLIPRMTSTQRIAITSPATGLMVFDTVLSSFYYYNGTSWTTLSSDNLGNHTATQNVNLGSNYLSNDGTNYGLKLDATLGGTLTGSNGSNYFQIGDNSKTFSALRLYNNVKEWTISNYNNKLQFHEENEDVDPFVIDSPTSDYLLYLKGDKVGIGTTTPSNILDIKTGNDAKVQTLSTGLEAGFIAVSKSGAGAYNEFSTYSGGNTLNRWSFGKNDDAETGSNLGSDFYINRYEDSGNYLNRVMNITRSNGYVGIGGNFTPSSTLHISGKTTTNNLKITDGASDGYILKSDGDGNAIWTDPIDIVNTSWTTSGTNTYFALTGNVGIGTDSPTNKLDVLNSTASTNAIQGYNTHFTAGTSWDLNQNFSAVSGKGGNAAYQAGVYGYVNGGANNTAGVLGFYDITTWGALGYRDNSSNTWGLYTQGSAKINGTLKTTNFQMSTGATNGYVLKSDASGNGTWISSTSLSITETDPKVVSVTTNKISKWNGTALTDGLIYDNGTNIGIGTTSPNYKLDIQGTGSLTSNLQSSTSSAYFSATSLSANESSVKLNTYVSSTSAPSRWVMGKGSSSESGSNAGSDFFINRYTDAGLYNGQPLAINRQNGTITVGNDGASTTENTLKLNGSLAVKRTAYSANATIAGNDHIVAVTTTGTITLILPSASSITGREYIIKSEMSSAAITINTTLSQTIDGVTTKTISTGYGVLRVYSDGNNWFTF